MSTTPLQRVCPNCQRPITCGCQKRKASDGADTCALCLTDYEQSLIVVQQARVLTANPYPAR